MKPPVISAPYSNEELQRRAAAAKEAHRLAVETLRAAEADLASARHAWIKATADSLLKDWPKDDLQKLVSMLAYELDGTRIEW